MEEHSVPVAELVFPVLLPFGEGVFLQHFVCCDDEHGCGCFESYASFDADDCVTDVHVATDGVWAGELFDASYCVYGVCEALSVDGDELSFFEVDGEATRFGGGHLCGVCFFGEGLFAVECFFASDACTPETFVDGVFHFLEVGLESVSAEVVDFVLAGEVHVTCGCDDFDFGGENLECEVEAYLVVSGACAAVCDAVCAYAFGVVDDGDGLEYSFAGYGYGVCSVAEDVSVYHVSDAFLVVFVGDVEGGVLSCAECECALAYGFEFVGAEASGVCDGCVYVVSTFFAEVFYGEGCVESAAECEYYFFL